jgi:antitoxin HicB
MTSYPIVIVELPESEGGGFLGTAPDLPGCLSDGATPDEALHNTQAAIAEWLATARATGRPIPPAGTDRLRAISEDTWTRLHPRRSAAG